MAFSGGGTRASALAYAVLRRLHAVSYNSGQEVTHRLTEDIKIISSVSGGSVTAAWYGLYPNDFDGLKTKFLTHDNMADLYWTAVNPRTWGRLAFSHYSRIDALIEQFDRLFSGNHIWDASHP
jgi:hypothetical protein